MVEGENTAVINFHKENYFNKRKKYE